MTHTDGDGNKEIMNRNEAGHIASILELATPEYLDVEEAQIVIGAIRGLTTRDPSDFPVPLAYVLDLEADFKARQLSVDVEQVVLDSLNSMQGVEGTLHAPLRMFASSFLREIALDDVAG